MNKKYFTSVSFILCAVALVLAMLSAILYGATGATQYNKEVLSPVIQAGQIVGILCLAGGIALDVFGFGKYGKYAKTAAYLMLFLAFVYCIVTETNFLGNIFVATDPVDPAYIVRYLIMALSVLAGAVLALVSANTFKEEKLDV